MSKQPATRSDMLNRLHIVTHLHWRREGHETFQTSRAALLDVLTGLLDYMQSGDAQKTPLKYFLLGGQTAIFEDVAEVRPELVTLLVIFNAGGRLGVGPWYLQIDETLVSGESIIRNLLAGRADARRHGIKLMQVAYMSDVYGYAPQLPQILRGFGIDAAFLRYDRPVMEMPFRWEAPDGSSVLVVNYSETTEPAKAVESQRFGQPDGPFLWMHDAAEYGNLPELASLQLPVTQSALVDYVAALRESLPDALRPSLKGEIGTNDPDTPGAGRLSARLYLKQINARLQAHLTYNTEPLLALALTHGETHYNENMRALLDYCWRQLMKNQTHHTLGGVGLDIVHDGTEIRNHYVEDVSKRLIQSALSALPGTPCSNGATTQSQKETYIAVWNPHSWTVKHVVDTPITIAEGHYPAKLISPDGEEIMFGWTETKDKTASGRLNFRAIVPPVGYAVYTLTTDEHRPDDPHITRTIAGNVIGNVQGETLLVNAGELIWRRGDKSISEVLRFYDGGDAGDAYDYRKPEPDELVQATLTDHVEIESSGLYERLILQHRMRIAPELTPKGGRGRGLRLINMRTSVTFYDNTPGAFFHTTFTNTAHDHRLRAHLNTGIKTDLTISNMGFGLVKRPVPVAKDKGVHTRPMHTLTAVQKNDTAIALLAHGLPEFEAIQNKEQTTLALTLLRAVGWANKKAGIAASGAQCDRDIDARFALVPVPPDNHAAWLRLSQAYVAPLQAYQYVEKPDTMQMSYLTIESENEQVLLTALKPPQNGSGWVLRLLNPTSELAETQVRPAGKIKSASVVNLAEEAGQELALAKEGIKVSLPPQKIMTLHIDFDRP